MWTKKSSEGGKKVKAVKGTRIEQQISRKCLLSISLSSATHNVLPSQKFCDYFLVLRSMEYVLIVTSLF